jgi:PAS domain S-box-containing protein
MNTTAAHTHRVKPNARPALFALLACLLVFATEQVIEHFARQSDLQREKVAVLDSLSTLRARLEGVVNANLLLVHGLSAVISAQPEIDQASFARIARGLVDERHALRNIAGAPDMVIRLMYPLAGNEAAIGLDYRRHPGQRAAAMRVMETGKSWVAGPLPLVQGGIGIIAREPVFLAAERAGEPPRFWGLVSAVLDADTLYRQAGLDTARPKLRLAIRGSDGTGAGGPVFFGDARVFASQPVTQTIVLPGGTWQIAALPEAGWGRGSTALWLIRLLGALTALAAGALAYMLARGGQALGASEARLHTLLNTLPDLVWLKDPNGVYLACNQRFEAFFGATEADIVGKTDHDFVPADLADFFREKDLAAIAVGGPSVNEEWLTFARDGHRELAETIKTPMFGGNGELLGVLGIARDVTERKRAEQVIQASEARYRTLLEMAPFPAVLSRVRDGVLLYGNHRAEIQYGIGRDEGIGQSADRFYDNPDDRARFAEAMRCQGHVDDFEARMRRSDGQPFWALVSASIVEFDNEPAIFASINDITSRKQAEAALREQEEFFRLIAENMGDLVAVLDLDGRRLYNSPSYRSLFGDVESLKGTDSFAEIHPDDQQRVRQVFRETVATGHGQRTTFRFRLPDGELREMESQGGVIRGPDGVVKQVVVVSRDITERRRMEDEIRQLNADLEQRVLTRTAELTTANKELETFTYSVSHDLKAPLRGIDGYSRLLLEDHREQLDEEGRLFLGNVRHGVDQMNQLIEDLLAYSRMERRDLQGLPVDLARQVAAALAERREEIAALDMQVEVDLDALVALVDPDGLAMVLRNLIDNALKFSRDSRPPTLAISATPTGKTVTLAIQDNGIGFDMQFHDRIFDIFQRLQRAEDYPGTGVGLAIVRKAMQRMGGRVWAASAPGQGATFYLELPR